LWPGQFINVALTLSTQSDAVVVPAEAVQVGPDGQHVFVVKPDNSVEVRPVVVARTDEGEAVIAKGLQAGEQIVREGQFLLGPGSRIEVRDGKTTEAGEQKREKGERRKDKAQERIAS
jgi:multidrug efflux system membrane fusion protein